MIRVTADCYVFCSPQLGNLGLQMCANLVRFKRAAHVSQCNRSDWLIGKGVARWMSKFLNLVLQTIIYNPRQNLSKSYQWRYYYRGAWASRQWCKIYLLTRPSHWHLWDEFGVTGHELIVYFLELCVLSRDVITDEGGFVEQPFDTDFGLPISHGSQSSDKVA